MIYRFPMLREILAEKRYGTVGVIPQGSQRCYKQFWLKRMLLISCLCVLLMSVTFVTDGLLWNNSNPNDVPQLRFRFFDIPSFDRAASSSSPNDPVVNINFTEDSFDMSHSRENDNLIMDVSITDSKATVSRSSGHLKSSINATRYPVGRKSTALLSSSKLIENDRRSETLPSITDQSRAVLNSSDDLASDGHNVTKPSLPLCPKVSRLFVGPIVPSMSVLTDQEILAANPDLQPGGLYKPPNCSARDKVAVIVVYRDRKQHLRKAVLLDIRVLSHPFDVLLILELFLSNIHPVLQKQQLDYGIFVVEQAGSSAFNRGMLFNVGFKEIKRSYGYDCFVMHDVDLLPENDRNPYSCPAVPTLLASAISNNQYRMPYAEYFGAAVSFTGEHFSLINGFSNLYWGWGGEDDDLHVRVISRYANAWRSSPQLGRYQMIRHGKDKGNPDNPKRFHLKNTATVRFFTDGLSNLNYTVLATEVRPLCTWFLVDIGLPPDDLPVARTYGTGGLWGG